MSNIKNNLDPAGEIKEDELVEVTSTSVETGAAAVTVVGITKVTTTLVTSSFCPTSTCTCTKRC